MTEETNLQERIRDLETQLQAEEEKIKSLFLSGKIPTAEDYAETDRIKQELKTARRSLTVSSKNDELKSKLIRFMVTATEYTSIKERADNKGLSMSEYIREVLNKTKYGNR